MLKDKMKKLGVPQWKLARALLICENSVQRKLRTPMSEEDYNLYSAAIDKMIGEREKMK